jgi:hypothetical protein
MAGGGKPGHGTHPRTPPQIFNVPQAYKDNLKDYENTTYRCELPVVLHVTLMKVASLKDSDFPLADWLKAAETILLQYNITLSYHPINKIPLPIPYNGGPMNLQTDIADIRQAAHKAFQDNGAPPRLPIILCEFSKSYRTGTAGDTRINQDNPPDGRTQLADGTIWLPFVLLPSGDPVPDNATLVHEVAHASMLKHDSGGGDNLNILDDNTALDRKQYVRRKINKFQIRKMARAYFALPKLVVK